MVDIIKSYINKYYEIKPVNEPERLIMKESQNKKNSEVQGVTLVSFHGKFYAFRITNNSNTQVIPIFNKSKKKINKFCDYIIVYEKDDDTYIFFIELKSKEVKIKHISEQFLTSTCFFDYILSLERHLFKRVINNYIPKYICFTGTGLKNSYTKNYNGIDICCISVKKGVDYSQLHIDSLIKNCKKKELP